MSRGISLGQRLILRQLLQKEEESPDPVPLLELEYGSSKRLTDWQNPRQVWNLEQAMRRALRNLEQRGLVKLGRYVFMPYPEIRRHPLLGRVPYLLWACQEPEQHIPGQSRILTGVLLTDIGRRVARDEQSITGAKG
jgi:hypothetical protein